MFRTVSDALFFESLLHAARLALEILTSPTETSILQRPSVPVHIVSSALLALRIGRVPPVALTCRLPFVAIAAYAAIGRIYEFALLAASVAILNVSCTAREDAWVVLTAGLMQLRVPSSRSNILRALSLGFLYAAAFAVTEDAARYLCFVGVEFASWATERYMLPWRVASAAHWGNAVGRFLLGFVVGVHIVDPRSGAEELLLRTRDTAPLPTLRGVACYPGGVVHLRYTASPLGVLLAYVEGLQLLPLRFCACAPDTITVFLFGVWDVDTQGWTKVARRAAPTAEAVPVGEGSIARTSHDDIAFACSSRFPFRRILLGFFLRMVIATTR